MSNFLPNLPLVVPTAAVPHHADDNAAAAFEAPEDPDEPVVRQTQVVKEVMAGVIDGKSAVKYAGQNIQLAKFCFERDELRDKLLEVWFIEEWNKTTNSRARYTYAKSCFLNMSPDDNNCPLKLTKLTFEIFSDFITLRTPSRGKNKGQTMALGNSSYEQSISALKHLYRMSKYSLPTEFDENLKMFNKGIKRKVANVKKASGDVAIIGKIKMQFAVYRKICELMLKEEGPEFLFARAFLILEWNLMARAENVVHAHILHVLWEDDAIVFRFVKSKADQTGRNRDQAWHVYANPHMPEICPVLALACYAFANPGVFSTSAPFNEGDDLEEILQRDEGRLFPGGGQYERFMGCLHRIVEKYSDELMAFGISPGELGSHSARKGSSSYAASGTTVSPPMVSICLRAMWSIGHNKERYLQYEKAGDQYLGRVVCGLNVNNKSFATSPPFFDFDDESRADDIYILIKDYMVQGYHVSARVHRIFYFCFASLCYHHSYLLSQLHEKNQLRASVFFTNIPDDAKLAVAVKYPWDSTKATPTFTGLPPHVVMMADFESLKLKMQAVMENHTAIILDGVKAELDRRRIGSQSHFDSEEIMKRMEAMHSAIMEKMEECGQNSASNLRRARFDDDDNDIQLGDEEGGDAANDAPFTIVHRSEKRRKFQFFFQPDGGIKRLPKGFVFSKMTFCQLITSWFCGNQGQKTIPFKLLTPQDMAVLVTDDQSVNIIKHRERMRCDLAHMKCLMQGVIAGAKKVDAWPADPNGAWTVAQTLRMYEAVMHLFQYRTKTGRSRRNVQLSWKSVYNSFMSHKKKFTTELGDVAAAMEVDDEVGDTIVDDIQVEGV